MQSGKLHCIKVFTFKPFFDQIFSEHGQDTANRFNYLCHDKEILYAPKPANATLNLSRKL